eukprot:scaffold1638_cov258-Pinguiococcus_pyrenoidosus.AAC.88
MMQGLILLCGLVGSAAFAPMQVRPTTTWRLAATKDAPDAGAVMDAAFQQVAEQIEQAKTSMGLSEGFVGILDGFLKEYVESNKEAGTDPKVFSQVLGTMVGMVTQQLQDPYKFSTFHQSVRDGPYDLYQWGNDFFRPLVIMEQSRLEGKELLDDIAEKLAAGDNVMFLSNHQTEADPQVISLLFEDNPAHAALAEKVICIAGHRVTTDPMAIPFSMGRNLLCIHSKKHIDNPPEEKEAKQKQNMETMNKLGELLAAGGQLLWVAPSGGRDRPNEDGEFVISPFDAKSTSLFQLLGLKSGKKLHFHPMAMFTHQLVPPPKEVRKELGEARSAKRGAARIAIGDSVNVSAILRGPSSAEAV